MDAWEAHHRGLWQMVRFNQPDNELAQHFFQMAICLDPTFSRAHAGVSFTHWQSAFQGWGRRDREIEQAYAAANQSLMVDDRDPAAHWAMGRALLLRGLKDQSIVELERAIDLMFEFCPRPLHDCTGPVAVRRSVRGNFGRRPVMRPKSIRSAAIRPPARVPSHLRV